MPRRSRNGRPGRRRRRVRVPTGRLARALAVRPLVALGRISYGVYLWHTPVFYYCGALAANGWHPSQPAVLLGWAATLTVSIVSYFVIEQRPGPESQADRGVHTPR